MRWPKYWSFSFSISPSSEHPGLISFRKCKSQPQWNNISYLLGMYIIKKADNNKHSCRSAETRTFICCQWECKIMELFWKTSWQFLKKLNIELITTWPSNSTPKYWVGQKVCLGFSEHLTEKLEHVFGQPTIYPEEMKTYTHKNCTKMFTAALSIIVKSMKSIQMCTSWCIDKLKLVYSYKGMLPGYGREWSTDTNCNMDDSLYHLLSDRSQSQKPHDLYDSKILRDRK